MATIPDQNFDYSNTDRLADWIELWCVVRPEKELSRQDIADVVRDSLLIEEESDPLNLTPQELAAERALDALTRLRWRQRTYGLGYPFEVGNDLIESAPSWESSLCFTALLMADVGRFYKQVSTDFDPESPFTRLFEKIVQAGLEGILGGSSARFGWPREPNWPKGIADRVRQLADELGLEADDPETKTDPQDKDIGLDVVTRLRIGDEGPGTAIVLTQCATGKNFRAKGNEPPLELWEGLLHWRAKVIRGVAFPWRQDIDDRKYARLAKKLEAIFFDRLRLFSGGNPDQFLDQGTKSEIRDWCECRLSEFPD